MKLPILNAAFSQMSPAAKNTKHSEIHKEPMSWRVTDDETAHSDPQKLLARWWGSWR